MRASAPVPGPIILISIDTLRADHLPAYGYRNVTTPAIDSLARDGIVFERAYGHAVQTLPAHIALLSGRLPFDTGVRDDAGLVKAGERLLPQMLRDRGYATGGIVSSGLLRRETGIAQGFNLFDDDVPGRRVGADGQPAAPRRRRSRGDCRALVEHRRFDTAVPLPAAARTARAIRGARTVRFAGSIRRRHRLCGRNTRPLRPLLEDEPALRSIDHRARLGPRRRIGRPRRTGAWAVCL